MERFELRYAIRMSRLAYEMDDTVNDELIVRNSSAAIVSKLFHPMDHQVVAIAGTNDIEDLSQAAMICGERNRHRGFYLHSLRIKKAIEYRISAKSSVTFIGHSLGGVCAQYLSIDLHRHVQSIQVLSIGAPKGWQRPFVLPENVRWTLWDNDLDLIPEYPLTKPFDWNHMRRLNGGRIKYYHIINGERGTPRGKWRKIVDILRPSFRSLSPRFTFDDTVRRYHSLNHYEVLSGEHGKQETETSDCRHDQSRKDS